MSDHDHFGDVSRVIQRTGVEPEDLGLDGESDPDEALDETIAALLAQATSEIRYFVGQDFKLHENRVDHLSGNGRDVVSTRQDPVRKIHSVEINGSPVADDKYRIEDVPGHPEENTGRIKRTGRFVWPRGAEIRVEYDWGYDAETRPAVLDRVAEDIVVELLEKAVADRKSSAKQSESMDGYSVSWDNSDVQDYLTLDEAKRKRLQPLSRVNFA